MVYDLLGLTAGIMLAVLLIKAFLTSQRKLKPAYTFSSLSDLTPLTAGLRARCAWLPKILLLICGVSLCCALANVRWNHESMDPITASTTTPTKGAALYLVLDYSGSMRRKALIEDSVGEPRFDTRLSLLKDFTRRLIRGDPSNQLPGRPNDLLGLVAFARRADILAPLTLDHRAILHKLDALEPVKNPADDGTGIGYAIYKVANAIAATRHFANNTKGHPPAYQIAKAALIVVTDGFQWPNPLDKGHHLRTIGIEDAATHAKKLGLRLYLINIDPRMEEKAFTPHRVLMKRSAELTGGKFYLVKSPEMLASIYRHIDTLEKTELPIAVDTASLPKSTSVPFFLAVSLITFFLSFVVGTVFIRQGP